MSISLNAAEFDRIVRLSQEGAGYEYESPGSYDNHLIVYVQVGGAKPEWYRFSGCARASIGVRPSRRAAG